MEVVLTNDDSLRSPLLEFIIDFLKPRAQIAAIFPKHEQSWKGKSITRFENLHIEPAVVHGCPSHLLTGTPADCASVGVYHLCKQKPDLLVSGINAGLNAGVSFCFASGTIGACFEANIAGVPAIALSQHFDDATFRHYISGEMIPESTLARLRVQTSQLLTRVFDKFFSQKQLMQTPVTWNVNLPFEIKDTTEIRLCPLGRSYYQNLFSRRENTFEHNLVDVVHDSRGNSDWELLSEGHVTVTPLDIHGFGQIDGKEIQALAKSFLG